MPRITTPRDIYFGRGCLDALKTLDGKKAFIVMGGSSVRKSGVLDKATGYLKEAGLEVYIFEGVEPDPSVETVQRGAAEMQAFGPDWIIPIGGGSPMDAAKAMWVLYEHPDADIFNINPFNMPPLRNKARFVAIPTTSGTGSEVTNASVVCDYSTGIKFGVAGFDIIPDIAILDPDTTDTMPKTLTAHTGLDALSHSLEAFVARFASPFSDADALYASKIVFDTLSAAYEGDPGAREAMHYAQCLAGMAFTSSMLGLSHAMAHKTGGMFDDGHIPHGLANSIYIPYVIQYNSTMPEAKAKYVAMARYVGVCGATDDELVAGLVSKVRAFASSLGSPKSLKEYGIPEAEWNAKLDEIAANAMKDELLISNPRKIELDTMKKVLQCIYDGTDIDF
ncbi:MAG: iron-containing alcohol dehydrogenase [Clostridiales bacterium]|nr:iron-containing alcohol dehydrogenase [Clostridiales bacterium]